MDIERDESGMQCEKGGIDYEVGGVVSMVVKITAASCIQTQSKIP
jgi:hypothetical protein